MVALDPSPSREPEQQKPRIVNSNLKTRNCPYRASLEEEQGAEEEGERSRPNREGAEIRIRAWEENMYMYKKKEE